MPIAVAAAIATASLSMPVCSWDNPGRNPFVGDVVSAVDRYQDIPADVRARLKNRMAARRYDEIVAIGRDGIQGRATYAPEIRDMHFGTGQTCGVVTRTRWAADQRERGLVYCEDEHCILVPTVCRNVSRITRESAAPAVMAARGTAPGGLASEGGGAGGAIGAPSETAPSATAASLDAAAGALAADSPSFAEIAGQGSPSAQPESLLAAAATPAGEAATVGLVDAGSASGGGTGFGAAPPLPWAGLGAGGVALLGPIDSLISPNTGNGGGTGGTGTGGTSTGSGSGSGLAGGGGLDLGPNPGTSGGGGTTDPISPVPEPGAWALWFAGLGLLGLLARRRRAG